MGCAAFIGVGPVRRRRQVVHTNPLISGREKFRDHVQPLI